MFKNLTRIVAALSLLGCSSFAQSQGLPRPVGLRCDLVEVGDYQSIGGYAIQSSPANLKDRNIQSVLIGSERPAFSWEVTSTGRDAMQTAYQILVADSKEALQTGKGNVWDSGQVRSGLSAGVIYDGIKLKPSSAYYWKVRVWAQLQGPSVYSAPASFYTDTALVPHKTPGYPLQITEEKPVQFSQYISDDTVNVYRADFGRAAFGQIKINLYSETGNDTVIVRLGELMDARGNIERKPPGNIRYAQYKLALHRGYHDYKIKINANALNTRSQAVKMPAYIGEVMPFRYCEIENYTMPLMANAFTRLAVHYNFNGMGHFKSSDPTLNAVWELCKYSMKATSFLGTYVDGDRERIPYEADAYINQLSHYAVDKEYTLGRRSHEYLITHPTWPTEWILQSVLIGWNDYLYTGDISSAKYYYADLKAKTLSTLADSLGLISTLNGKLTKDVYASIHLTDKMRDIVDWPHGPETDGFVFTKYNAVVNAFYYRSLVLMSKLATDMGNTADAKMYGDKASSLKKAYQKVFFDTKRRIYIDGANTDHASLHTNMFAMAFGLVDDKYKANVQAFIKSRGMACSVYGSQFLLDAIYDAGDAKYGLALLTSKSDRSWYNMIRLGSTITLEAWDNKYKPNQDWNHAWGAAAGNIISRKLMGIEPLTPGWSSFSIKPQIDTLSQASIIVPTIKGPIKAEYDQTPQWFNMRIEIPANTQAQIYIPTRNRKHIKVWMNGQPVIVEPQKQTALIPNVGSGQYLFEIRY